MPAVDALATRLARVNPIPNAARIPPFAEGGAFGPYMPSPFRPRPRNMGGRYGLTSRGGAGYRSAPIPNTRPASAYRRV